MTPSRPIWEVPFTVGVCTLDRLDYLKETISAVLAQLGGFANARLFIVDNGSTDETSRFLTTLAGADPRVGFAIEPRRGLYFARAVLIDQVHTEYLIFMDDDALPQGRLFERLLRALEASPDAGAIGCAVDPLWEAQRPAWLDDRLLEELCVHPNVVSGDCRFPRFPPGICLAVRVNACLRLYAAPERRANYVLGRHGTSYAAARYELIGGEDTDLCEIYCRNGFRVFWLPDARVFHRVPADRMTADWLLRKFEGDGRTRIRLLRLGGVTPFGRHGLKMLAALPLAFGLAAILRIAGASRHLLAEAYYRKSRGAWRELLFGAKISPASYECAPVDPKEPDD
jgi:glycosyltransferase involved in cell wall biosynthesis